eukprot:Skav220372  [mRNA]  locus=scaffold609:178587:181238:+ [translate_table: standard]
MLKPSNRSEVDCTIWFFANFVQGYWRTNLYDRTVPHFELQGKVLGLIGGSGGIGSKVAQLAEAIGMKVVITSAGLDVQETEPPAADNPLYGLENASNPAGCALQ